MHVYYISPSTIPARAANSIHVVNMCEALAGLDNDVTLFVRSPLPTAKCREALQEFYGIDNSRIKVVAFRSRFSRGAELLIACRALLHFMGDRLQGRAPGAIVSRNLYGALLFGLLCRRRLVYETHAPDKGLRRLFQSRLLKSSRTPVLVISDALRQIMASLHGVPRQSIHVLHDAARSGQEPLEPEEKRRARHRLLGDRIPDDCQVVGYFGHLYAGRGIEVIQGIAARNPATAFIVYGGNEEDIRAHKAKNQQENLHFMGHLAPGEVRLAMAMMDVLLMPYQRSVTIQGGLDTSRWMSPMKLFEYMSVGVPIISSDLPVLREVLTGQENCLLVPPDDVEAWSDALRLLARKPDLATRISQRAHHQYLEEYTWISRARRMLVLAGGG